MSFFGGSISSSSFFRRAVEALPQIKSTGSGDNQISIKKSQSDPNMYDVTIDGKTETWSKKRLENTTFDLGSGDDVLNAEGLDVQLKVNGRSGDDTITTGSGNDFINAGTGNDVVRAGAGNDFVDGGAGHDKIEGQSGDDTLRGGSGNDYIAGGSGDDHIFGGFGQDLLEGGSGENTVQQDPSWFLRKFPVLRDAVALQAAAQPPAAQPPAAKP